MSDLEDSWALSSFNCESSMPYFAHEQRVHAFRNDGKDVVFIVNASTPEEAKGFFGEIPAGGGRFDGL